MRRRHRFLTSPLSLFALSLAVLAGCGGRPPVGSNADGAGTQDAATSGKSLIEWIRNDYDRDSLTAKFAIDRGRGG